MEGGTFSYTTKYRYVFTRVQLSSIVEEELPPGSYQEGNVR